MLKALKSCLVCQTSYCETHLEPHQRIAALKRHKLINTVENLVDRMCKKHDRLLELFCRSDQTCTEADHKTHNTVPQEEEYGEKMAELGKMMAEVQQMMHARSRKVKGIKHSVELSKRVAERKILDSVQVFTALVHSIERSQAELIEVVKEKHKKAERQAEGLIKELEQEMNELQRSSSHTLRTTSSRASHLCTLPPTKDWSKISVHSDLYVGTGKRVVSQLGETLNKEMDKVIEEGRFYYEVTVKGKTKWDLGVARESINRKGNITLSPKDEYWTVALRERYKYLACTSPPVLLSLREKPQKVGVFVDYEED
ncbi:E3 ubiquitin-protein ligase TRIM21-like [Salvelinus alpinus]|uniref:E3 ubiquitin-protein ligase TRIM21-like n=1 Tax=Salvelinus alpinus TaxID=8036 RepID=UPI0039FD8B36